MPALINLQKLEDALVVKMNGSAADVIIAQPYSPTDKLGVTIIVVCASLSLACLVFLLVFLASSFWRNRDKPSNHFFVRSHAAAYFACLLVSDLIQGIGTLMSSKWLQNNGIILDGYCSVQGAIKNVGNVGISLWTLALAIHTFVVLFLRWNPREWALYATLGGVWLLIAFIAMLGPSAIQKSALGPYFGISGLWCWITDSYPVERITMEYMWMLGAAFLSFLFYMATFLRLRGNIYIESGRMKFRRVTPANSWKYVAGRDAIDIELTKVAKGMIGYPILFTIVVVPIAICRFIEWSGKPVPDTATIFAACVFSLTGVFDLILFLTTRSLLPEDTFFQGNRVAPRKEYSTKPLDQDGVQPYLISDFASAHGFDQMYQQEAERQLVTLPPRTLASLGRSSSTGMDDFKYPSRIDTAGTGQMPTRPHIQVEGQTPVSAWDDIDIGRRVQPAEDNFGEAHLSRPPAAFSYEDSRVPGSGMDLHSEYRSSAGDSPEDEEERGREVRHTRKISSSSTRI